MELAITTAIESLGRQQPSLVVPRPSTVALLFDHLFARASRVGGTSRPSAFAVLRLIVRKNLVAG